MASSAYTGKQRHLYHQLKEWLIDVYFFRQRLTRMYTKMSRQETARAEACCHSTDLNSRGMRSNERGSVKNMKHIETSGDKIKNTKHHYIRI